MLGRIIECVAMCWERQLSLGRCVATDICVWSDVLGPIFECGSMCLELYLSVERFVGTDN